MIWFNDTRMELPQGVFLVVILRVLVGILTGPFTFSSLSLAPLIRSWQTFSRDFTFLRMDTFLSCYKFRGSFFTPGGQGDSDPVDWRLLLNSLSILARKDIEIRCQTHILYFPVIP